ncbi:prephenate dehydratase [Aestuariivirga litoralis]|uniref:prephenate dehydratase n=1 Tax=Aestuariivirga litoralis TaxID=2650924 RepID=UPI0018C57D64|nr:prephenate dehydratase [Aestuariivirga litoralis]MBG1232739.1 prephenate dehydratase [Aestuariivirga litoralis]
MSKKKIAYQGEPGANSHIACLEARPDHEPMPCHTFEDAFQAVKDGRADLAMIAIENTTAGRVADVHHLLPDSGLWIVGEHFLRIRFQLLVLPGVKLKDVKTVHSHVHALGQCRKAIKAHKLQAVVAVDTAGAARELAEIKDRTRAAIATKLAGEIYGLQIAARDIEDEDHNTTRFVILSKKPQVSKPGNGPVMTSFVFRVRNVPAALYKAMGGFATNGINMTKLESYQIEGQFNATQFYADVEGHPQDRGLQFALEELEFFTSYMKILGTYPSSPYRAELAKKLKG